MEDNATQDNATQDDAPRRRDTMQIVSEKREEWDKALTFSYFSVMISACLGFAYLYVGFMVKPLKTCHDPFPLFYKGEGIITIVQALCLYNVLAGAKRMEANDDFLRAQIYQEQHRTADHEQAVNQFIQQPGVAANMASMGLAGCAMCCASCIDLPWMLWGVYMGVMTDYFGHGCQKMTTCLWYLILASVVIQMISMCVRQKVAPPPSPAAE